MPSNDSYKLQGKKKEKMVGIYELVCDHYHAMMIFALVLNIKQLIIDCCYFGANNCVHILWHSVQHSQPCDIYFCEVGCFY